jgi:hypothetical protein
MASQAAFIHLVPASKMCRGMQTGAEAAGSQSSSQQLAAAVHDIQHQQVLMWAEVNKQAQTIEALRQQGNHQLQHPLVDTAAAGWATLGTMKQALEQSQHALQQMQQHQQPLPTVELLQQSPSQHNLPKAKPSTAWQNHQPQHCHHHCSTGDSLDMFIVETQMVSMVTGSNMRM